MSVYTQLTDDQFAAFCQSFGVSFARAIPITQGIKNSNWFIQTTDDVDGQQHRQHQPGIAAARRSPINHA